MLEHLPKEILEGLAQARRRERRRRNRLRVRVGDEMVPILRFGDEGFSLDAQDAPQLRGLVDIFDGGRHLCQALIVYSALEGDEMLYEYKRNTAATDRAPLDFPREDDAPVGLLPRA